MLKKNRGLTLVEVVITLGIIVLVSLWAINTYQGYLFEQQEVEAIRLLQSNAAFMEEYRTTHGQYKATPSSWPTLPHVQAPASGIPNYRLSFGSTPRNTDPDYYLLRATRLDRPDEILELNKQGLIKKCAGTPRKCNLR